MKRQPTDWKKIFSNDETDKGLVSKIYEQLMWLNIKTTQSKNGHKTQIDIFPRKTYRWQRGT